MRAVSVIGQPQGRQTLRDLAEQQPVHGHDTDGPADGPGPGPGPGAGRGPGGSVSGHARLQHSDGPWFRAAGGAEALHTHLAPARAELEKSHEGLLAGESAGHFAVLRELAAVRESWVRRVGTAQGECGSLAGEAAGRRPGTERDGPGGAGELRPADGRPGTAVAGPAPRPVATGLGADAPSALYFLGGSDT